MVQRKKSREIERKFLVERFPSTARKSPHDLIQQGYLAISQDPDDLHGAGPSEVRIRRKGRRHFLTVKAGLPEYADGRNGSVRAETEISISGKQFSELWPRTRGLRVEKTRYRLPISAPNRKAGLSLTIELDVYHGALRGLMTAEVEFPSEAACARFVPPAWFGRDVTDDDRYKNRVLAQRGKP